MSTYFYIIPLDFTFFNVLEGFTKERFCKAFFYIISLNVTFFNVSKQTITFDGLPAMIKKASYIIVLVFLWLLPFCSLGQDVQPLEFTSVQMGTQFRIVIYHHDDALARKASQAAFQKVEELNGILSDYEENSELNRLSRSSGSGKWLTVSEPLFTVLERSAEVFKKTGGLFDVTIGPYTRLWRDLNRLQNPELPGRNEMDELSQKVGNEFLKLDKTNRSVKLMHSGMQLDAGGIAKGYAADEALKILNEYGISTALVDAGGDISLGSQPPGKEYWNVVVPLSRQNDKTDYLELQLQNGAVSTSGNMFQYVEIDGQTYSHIIDPRTGLGITQQVQVTVIAGDGLTADAYASALNIMQPEQGIEWINSLDGIEAFIEQTDSDGINTWKSSAFEKYVTPDYSQ